MQLYMKWLKTSVEQRLKDQYYTEIAKYYQRIIQTPNIQYFQNRICV